MTISSEEAKNIGSDPLPKCSNCMIECVNKTSGNAFVIFSYHYVTLLHTFPFLRSPSRSLRGKRRWRVVQVSRWSSPGVQVEGSRSRCRTVQGFSFYSLLFYLPLSPGVTLYPATLPSQLIADAATREGQRQVCLFLFC